MLLIALLSLVAGALTVLAPCVLPFLPVIVGGSLTGSRRRPFIIAASLVVSLLLFTLLLKASTLLIDVDPRFWTIASGVLVIILGVVMLFPSVWTWISVALRFDRRSHELLSSARGKKSDTGSAILTGIALGPVFSSCSPTYAWVIATILPASPALGFFYLALYCVGLTVMLLLIALLGRRIIDRLGWAANPRGWFQRILAILFILVGVFIATGLDRKVQTWAVDKVPGLIQLEQDLIPTENAPGNASPAAAGENISPAATDGDVDSAPTAPELTGLTNWINSDPLTLEDLRGKVVLVDFWTYSCINCQRTQPFLNSWYDAYENDGLVILGVHAPEFSFEKRPGNVERAVREAGIEYPVALDNDFATWRAYSNQYWPAKYLIDQDGRIRYTHFGEGEYKTTENMIRELLGTDEHADMPNPEAGAGDRSPETYLGIDRANGHVGEPDLAEGRHTYHAAEKLPIHGWTLGGDWEVDGEKITARSPNATLSYRFTGKEVYLVLGGREGGRVRVKLEGTEHPGGADAPDGVVTIDSDRLYRLVSRDGEGPATVTITFDPGVSANAFTFG